MKHFCWNCWYYTAWIIEAENPCADDRCPNWLCHACSTPAPIERREHKDDPPVWDYYSHCRQDPETHWPIEGLALQYTGGPHPLCAECAPPTEELWDINERVDALLTTTPTCPMCGSPSTAEEHGYVVERFTLTGPDGSQDFQRTRPATRTRCRMCAEARNE